jgi:thioester reductase-like protein
MRGRLLLTGATGFVGARLLEAWLQETSVPVTLLIRARQQRAAADRVREALAALGCPETLMADIGSRVHVIEADLTHARLGLAPADHAQLARSITHILHCAAVVRFNVSEAEAERTNVAGTANVLELAASCSALERFDYVSTTYVAGARTGSIFEDEFDAGQQHHNAYEKTKFAAEKLVRQYATSLPVTILRPSIVMCDARNGAVPPASPFARLFRNYVRGLLREMPGRPDTMLDIVSADYLAKAVLALARDPHAIGGCFHLSAGLGNCVPLGELIELASREFDLPPLRLLTAGEFEASSLRTTARPSAAERLQVLELGLCQPYLMESRCFDNRNCTSRLQSSGLEPPTIRSYFAKMAQFIRARAGRPAR